VARSRACRGAHGRRACLRPRSHGVGSASTCIVSRRGATCGSAGVVFGGGGGPMGRPAGVAARPRGPPALRGAPPPAAEGPPFPDSDAAYEGLSGSELLGRVAGLVIEAGFAPSSCDVTVVCDRPAIAPRRDEMRARLGEILALGVDRISVKATRPEGLGLA